MSIAVESDLFILPVFKMLAPAPVSQQQTYLQPPQQYPYQPPPQIISPQDPSKQYAQVSQIKCEKVVSISHQKLWSNMILRDVARRASLFLNNTRTYFPFLMQEPGNDMTTQFSSMTLTPQHSLTPQSSTESTSDPPGYTPQQPQQVLAKYQQ